MFSPTHIVIHHTATPKNAGHYQSIVDAKKYHAVIYQPLQNQKPLFKISVPIDRPSLFAVYMRNSTTLSIAVVGNFNDLIVDDQLRHAIVQIATSWARKFSIPARNIITHQDSGRSLAPGIRYSTECPGLNLSLQMNSIRSMVDGYLKNDSKLR